MAENDDNFGGTTLIGENGEQMDPAIAGISAPSIPTIMNGDAAGAAAGADLEDDTAGDAEMEALDEEDDDEADVTASGAE